MGHSPLLSRAFSLPSVCAFIGFVATFPEVGASQSAEDAVSGDRILADSGKAFFKIVSPTPDGIAAAELARYLEKMSGAHFDVSPGGEGNVILIGEKGQLEAELPNLQLPDLRPDGYAIVQRGERIVLAGENLRGTTYAVHRFLEELGCRWLAPAYDFYAGDHEVVPSVERLVWKETADVIDGPVLRYRKLYIEEGRSHTPQNLLQLVEWMPKAAFNILVIPIDYEGAGRVTWDDWRAQLTPALQRRGIIIEVGGHGYQNFLNAEMEGGRLFEMHPEWFGLHNGSRTAERRRVFCTSNEEAVAYLHGNVLRYLKERPEIEIFDFWPPDGGRWCECDECESLGDVPERHAQMVHGMAELLQREIPHMRLECIAYGHYREPPENSIIPADVLVDFCPISQDFEYQIHDEQSPTNSTYRRSLLAWTSRFDSDLSIYSYYRKYAWRSLPVVIPRYMQNDIRWYHSMGVSGVSIYAEPGDWATYELNHYILGKLAWDPERNVEKTIDAFLAARFGPAADIASEAYGRLEEIVRRGSNIPGTRKKTPDEYAGYLREIEASLAAVEGAGEQRLPEQSPSRAPLQKLALMLRYAQLNLRFQQADASGASGDEKRLIVEQIAGLTEGNADEGIFLVEPRLTRESLLRYYKVIP